MNFIHVFILHAYFPTKCKTEKANDMQDTLHYSLQSSILHWIPMYIINLLDKVTKCRSRPEELYQADNDFNPTEIDLIPISTKYKSIYIVY